VIGDVVLEQVADRASRVWWMRPGSDGDLRWESLVEREYFSELVAEMRTSGAFTRPVVILSRANDPRGTPILPLLAGRFREEPVVFYLSAEKGDPVPAPPGVHVVLQAYLRSAVPERRTLPLPIGTVAGRWARETPTGKRDIDVCFTGLLTPPRARMLAALGRRTQSATLRMFALSSGRLFAGPLGARLERTPPDLRVGVRNEVHLSTAWAGGLDADDYLDLLARSHVALAPRGWSSTETFRLMEAASAGCRVVTEPLPDTFVYRDHPFNIVRRPSGWSSAVRSALHASHDDERQGIRVTRKFWEDRLSPQGASRVIRALLREHGW
jgi:hypothetical protein